MVSTILHSINKAAPSLHANKFHNQTNKIAENKEERNS
jgi:hypothetical protein